MQSDGLWLAEMNRQLECVRSAAEQLKNSCGAASKAITSRVSKPPHNSMLN